MTKESNTISLREIQRMLDKASKRGGVAITERYVAMQHLIGSGLDIETKWIYYPQLRNKEGTKYDDEPGFRKHLDRMISRHGPDARFKWDDSGYTSDARESGHLTDQPIEEGSDDEQEPQSKGVREGLSFANRPSNKSVTNGKGASKCNAGPPGSVPRTFGASNGSPVVRSNPGGSLPAAKGRGGLPSTRGTYNPLGKGSFGPASQGGSRGTGVISNIGKTAGVGTRSDANEKDASRPISAAATGLKTQPYKEANEGSAGLTRPLTDWGMYPHPIYSTSFSAFTVQPKYKLPPATWGKAPSLGSYTPVAGAWKSELEVGDFSDADSFGDGNPGGHVEAAFAKLKSKGLRAQAKSIQGRMEMIFRMNEVGIGQDETPRLSPIKLIKELVGRSVRMAKTRKEERGAGLKMILVDISPSCAATRDACYAAALAIADADPNVVVFAHFNGYATAGDADSLVVGTRYKEVPIITEDEEHGGPSQSAMSSFEEFLASGKLAGAIAFGDSDAASLYGLIAKYAPMVWMTPFEEDRAVNAIRRAAGNDYCFDKASLYVIPDVVDCRSAVKGMEAVLKAKKL
jgi:hypothetical protein